MIPALKQWLKTEAQRLINLFKSVIHLKKIEFESKQCDSRASTRTCCQDRMSRSYSLF